jgi:hypothetical protein
MPITATRPGIIRLPIQPALHPTDGESWILPGRVRATDAWIPKTVATFHVVAHVKQQSFGVIDARDHLIARNPVRWIIW